MRRRLAAIGFSLAACAGCATTALAPVATKDFAFEEDEKRLWRRADEIGDSIVRSGLVYRDDALDAYLNGVARKLQPPDVFASIPFRVTVVKDPRVNAFALPNGLLFLHTGILARMENEAQLATLVGHEMAHATHRHGVKSFRSVKNKTAWLAGMVAIGGDIGALLGGLGTMAAVTGYSRDLEREADEEGFRRMADAGYDPGEAPKLFAHIRAWNEENKIKDPFFFSTHPRLQEREESFQALIASRDPSRGGAVNREVFLKVTKAVVHENVLLELKANRPNSARKGAEKLIANDPSDARAHFLLGESYRRAGGDNNVTTAAEWYGKAIALDPGYADPCRELGVIHYKRGEKAEAARNLERYLALAPRAPDRAYVEEYLRDIRREGR